MDSDYKNDHKSAREQNKRKKAKHGATDIHLGYLSRYSDKKIIDPFFQNLSHKLVHG